MYCPECALQNVDAAKFCRACGTDLEIVSLALTNKIPTADTWLEKRGESLRKVVTGSILLGAALLIGIVPAFFMHPIFPWAMIWTVFFGWMAVWGAISLAFGIGGTYQAKMMLRHTGQLTDAKTPTAALKISSSDYAPPLLDKRTTSQLSSPPSVTEHTTKQLNKYDSDV